MKKVAFVLFLASGIALISCSGKKTSADQVPTAADSAAADTIVVSYGAVQVDSIAPDSAQVTVSDTTLEMIAIPEESAKKEKEEKK